MSDASALARLIAKDEIRDLAYRYSEAIADRDSDRLASLFSQRASFGGWGTGPDAAKALMAKSMEGNVLAVVLVANHRIDLESDTTATGSVWARCFAQAAETPFYEQLLRYDDRYELEDGQWRFAHRKHRLWYGVATAESPLEQPAADWPSSQVGVGDLPLVDPVFASWRDRR